MASEKYDSRVFDKAQLIEVTIDEEDLMSFLVKMDIGDNGKPKYPEDELARLVLRVLPEYVFAWHEDADLQSAMAKVAEAAQRLYKTDPYSIMYRYYIGNDTSLENEVRKLMEITLSDYETGKEKQLVLNCLSPMAEKLDDKIRNCQLLANSQLNELSLTLTLVLDNYRFYFGGDAPDSVIIHTNSKELEQSRWIKIPHHGSQSSKSLTGMLNRQLDSAACTAYSSQGLPNNDVLSEYNKRTERLYITHQANNNAHSFGMIEYEYIFEGAEITLNIRRYGNAYKYTSNDNNDQ